MAISGKTCYVKELWKKIVYAIMKKKKEKKEFYINRFIYFIYVIFS